MEINPKKSKVAHFRPKSECVTNNVFWTTSGPLKVVEHYKYLGVTLDCHGETRKLVEQLANASSKALGQGIGKTRTVHDLCYHSFTKLFESCVSPIMDYASGAWSAGETHKKLSQVQDRACRYFCGLSHNCSIAGMMGDIGWTPDIVQQDLNSVRLYNQLVSMNSDHITHTIFYGTKEWWNVTVGHKMWGTLLKALTC